MKQVYPDATYDAPGVFGPTSRSRGWKLKARYIIPGWPRGRSTSVRYLPWYYPVTPVELRDNVQNDEYHRGQQEMVNKQFEAWRTPFFISVPSLHDLIRRTFSWTDAVTVTVGDDREAIEPRRVYRNWGNPEWSCADAPPSFTWRKINDATIKAMNSKVGKRYLDALMSPGPVERALSAPRVLNSTPFVVKER